MSVTPSMDLPADGVWRHSFDTAVGGGGRVNPGLGRADAFVRFMDEEGVPPDRVTVAVVVHDDAIADVVDAERREADTGTPDNPNVELVERILAAGGEIWVCGRAAEAQGVGDDDLLPGVRFAPSAMIANAELQRRGFSLNPY
jgi:intracellular sulfur oxidation DsrE/DsrF family protein